MPSSGYRKILVGTDGSESSFSAVDRAASVAAGTGAQLILLCAYRPMDRREEARAAEELGQEAYKIHGSNPAETALSDAEDRAKAAGARDIARLAVEGDAAEVLVRTAVAENIDLLVVGNRGLNRFGGRLLGSVPANISHEAKCDFLVVHTTSGR